MDHRIDDVLDLNGLCAGRGGRQAAGVGGRGRPGPLDHVAARSVGVRHNVKGHRLAHLVVAVVVARCSG